MNNNFAILSYLDKNKETSQRKIGKGTGLSAATVNLMLKKMVQKGWIKLERVNTNTLRYIITSEGLTEKTRLAYRFMKNLYKQINQVNKALEKIVSTHHVFPNQLTNQPTNQLLFYGPQDGIIEILKLSAGNLGLKYKFASTLDELGKFDRESMIVVVWREEDKDEQAVNILEIL